MAIWRQGFDKRYILDQINSIRRKEGKKVSYSNATTLSYWLPILQSSLSFETNNVNEHEEIVSKALNRCGAKIRPDEFLNELQKTETELLTAPKKIYTVFCQTTYHGPRIFRSIQIKNTRLIVDPSPKNHLFQKLKSERGNIGHRLDGYYHGWNDESFQNLVVRVSARNIWDAYACAQDALRIYRFCLNSLINHGSGLNPFRGLEKPSAINKVLLGPITTIHDKAGNLLPQMIWYQKNWQPGSSTVNIRADPHAINRNMRRTIKQLTDNPYPEKISVCMDRYLTALDADEFIVAIIDLWGVLETATDTTRSSYDLTIRRLLNVFGNDPAVRVVLQHLRVLRNQAIHSGVLPSSDHQMNILRQAEQIASMVVYFIARKSKHFSDFDDLIFFMDIDHSRKSIDGKSRALEYARVWNRSKNQHSW